MLEELFNLVKNAAGQSVINNPDVPNEQNEEVVAEATNTVASGLRNMVAGGGLQNLLQLFGGKQSGKGGLMNNPLVSMMIGHFANKLMNKFRLGSGQANTVANNLIPSVLENLINKTNDPNDNKFSLEGLLNSITGGQSSDLLKQTGGGHTNLNDLLNQFGGNQGNSGGGLMDIVTKMAQGAQQQQQKNGGSLLDLIKGFTR
ncbi:MAG TPA: hypothetical protein VNA26_05290 [Chitinophagaceae bacterium]|nr:hypothetical protein [Chitinophagaceae bacterium]